MNHPSQFNRKRRRGKHLRYSDRQLLETIVKRNENAPRKKRLSQKAMAEIIQTSESTISRELKRGAVTQLGYDYRTYTSYSAEVAQQNYDRKASNKGPSLKIGHDLVLVKDIERLLLGIDDNGQRRQPYSPDAVIMQYELTGWPTETRICTRTLYNYIEADLFLGVTQTDLPRGAYQNKRKKRRVRRSYKVATGRQIEDRPIEADERSEYGHWEMDCIESVRGDRACILSLVERSSREAILFKLSGQTQTAVNRALNGLERSLGSKSFRQQFKSITVDNGAEFWNWEQLEQSVFNQQPRTRIYYAHPYSSWERGSNENLNGLVRYAIPKGTRIRGYTKKDIRELAEQINHYPRRLLDGQTAAMVSAKLKRAQ